MQQPGLSVILNLFFYENAVDSKLTQAVTFRVFGAGMANEHPRANTLELHRLALTLELR